VAACSHALKTYLAPPSWQRRGSRLLPTGLTPPPSPWHGGCGPWTNRCRHGHRWSASVSCRRSPATASGAQLAAQPARSRATSPLEQKTGRVSSFCSSCGANEGALAASTMCRMRSATQQAYQPPQRAPPAASPLEMAVIVMFVAHLGSNDGARAADVLDVRLRGVVRNRRDNTHQARSALQQIADLSDHILWLCRVWWSQAAGHCEEVRFCRIAAAGSPAGQTDIHQHCRRSLLSIKRMITTRFAPWQ